MTSLIECVPNFSEGRRPDVVDAIVDDVVSVPGVILLGREMDPDHNRAVVSFAGPPDAVRKAAFAACARASELINLELHTGVHPRMGATDVIPFVPVCGSSMKTCVRLAHELGAQIAEYLHIPVYLYGYAAKRPDRENLAVVRNGEYEGLRTAIGSDPLRLPDFGPPKLHPTAGAVAVGARNPLIAYNILLATPDVKIARRIARKIRAQNGGLPGVKALGFLLNSRGLAQVSMNITDHKKTSVRQAFEAVEREAKRYGVDIVESELIGLINLDAVTASFRESLKLRDFSPSRIVEYQIRSSP